jgi:hypothetical protein
MKNRIWSNFIASILLLFIFIQAIAKPTDTFGEDTQMKNKIPVTL